MPSYWKFSVGPGPFNFFLQVSTVTRQNRGILNAAGFSLEAFSPHALQRGGALAQNDAACCPGCPGLWEGRVASAVAQRQSYLRARVLSFKLVFSAKLRSLATLSCKNHVQKQRLKNETEAKTHCSFAASRPQATGQTHKQTTQPLQTSKPLNPLRQEPVWVSKQQWCS